MNNPITHQRIAEACDKLFGENFQLEKSTFEYLQISGIKSAFRTKVKACHPDLNGEDSNLFCEVKEAYDFLLHLKTNDLSNRAFKNEEGRFYKARIPKRKLRFAEYLYYTGIISWNTLIDAIVWHKRQKNRIGNYFIQKGILDTNELTMKIIKMNIHNRKHQ